MPSPPSTTLRAIRTGMLALLLAGLLGTGVELLLLEHTDGAWQLFPNILLGLALLVGGWHGATGSAGSLRALRVLMAAFVVAGLAGLALHYRGNVEWELERTPDLGGFALFKEAIMGATPTLAPGTMILLGLLGLLYGYHHPALTPEHPEDTSS